MALFAFFVAQPNLSLAKGRSSSSTISARWGDKYNLADLGAALDGSSTDNATIQSIYNALGTGAVIEIPKNSQWTGTINSPSPSKHMTYLFDGLIPGTYTAPPGDGDTSISYGNGLSSQRRDLNSTGFNYPIRGLYWNDDQNYSSTASGNYTQYAAANLRAISGPVSQGNTSPLNLNLQSYGRNQSSSYDIGLPVSVLKYGTNATWGLVVNVQDFSGQSPGAFSSWNEYDIEANGQDIKSWSPSYGVPQAGNRTFGLFRAKTHDVAAWAANTSYTVPCYTQGCLPTRYLIKVSSPDTATGGQHYVWYPVQAGTSGATAPTFPTPAHFIGSMAYGVLTVSSVAQGAVNVGDYISGSGMNDPILVESQLTGTSGGAGTYKIASYTAYMTGSHALYSVPQVTDGTVTWQFGTEYEETISSGFWFGGASTYDTVLGVDGASTVSGAVIDTELAGMGTTGVPLRIADGQLLDLSGNGTLAGRNQHTFGHGSKAFQYGVAGALIHSVKDDGVETTSVCNVVPSGSTISDATTTGCSVVVLNPTAAGQGVLASGDMGTIGAQQTFINNGTTAVKIYPVAASWGFSGKTKGDAIILPHGAVLRVTSYSTGSGLMAASLTDPVTVSNVGAAYPPLTLASLTALAAANLSDGQHARCSDCMLNGRAGVDVVWNAAAAIWTDSQNNALSN